jgi:hypothetical protein
MRNAKELMIAFALKARSDEAASFALERPIEHEPEEADHLYLFD